MNIALVILHADPARGGAERYSIDLAKALSGRGHEVSLLASSFAPEPSIASRVPLDARAPTRRRRYLRFLASLEAHLADHRYDIVHAMLPVRNCDIYHPHAGLAAEAIVSGHLKHANPVRRSAAKLANHLNSKRRTFAKIEQELLESDHPPITLCLSAYVESALRRHYSLPEDCVARLFNAVDLEKFNPSRSDAPGKPEDIRALGPDRIVALMIAQDYRRKGLPEAIAGLAQINDPRLALVVVGKEPPGVYASLARQKGVADRVIFAGPTTDPVSYYRASDFFILPTRHDPCSLVVLESLAMGLPVISTMQNGACEIMTDGTHGFVLADADDAGRLADAMRRMMDPQVRQSMSRACLLLRPALSQQQHVDRLLEIYRRRRPS